MFCVNSLIVCLFSLWIFCIGISILVRELFSVMGLENGLAQTKAHVQTLYYINKAWH
ncbi:hypothetical protein HanIR_Chr12g0592381 [Helianthus annuus]|nr:hypothetical protein HanIR_Chr12g0592381 [Helianthus annuus]